MGAGDETILGPYDTTTAGVTTAGAAMDTAYATNTDKYVVISGANNMQFWIIHIEGSATT